MSIEKTPLWRAALDYVSKGYRVIPIWENRKNPLTTNWHENALETPEAVDAMWEQYPNANIAVCPDDLGLAVIDADPGASDLSQFPPTRTNKTPRGGYHFFYIGSIPPTVGKLGDHIDTRGQRSYVLLPPSIVEGKPYAVYNDRPAVALPPAIEARLAQANKQALAAETRVDLPGNVATARTRLSTLCRTGVVAISGRGGNDLTYRVVSELVRDLGISPDLSIALLNEGWNQACVPPWSTEELQTIIANVSRYGQNAQGAYAAALPAETFAGANLTASSAVEGPQSNPVANPFKMLGTKEQNELPEPSWLLKDVLPENRIVLMSAQKGHFKTFLALDLALAIATNKETFGAIPESDGLVVYSAHESLEEIARLHRPAWFAVKGVDQASETGFYLTQGVHVGFTEERQQFEDALDALVAREGRPLKLIVVDTYSAAMASLDENNPTDITNVIGWARGVLARHPGACMIVVAHKGKDAERGARGSSALEYGVDTLLDVDRIDNGMQVKVTVRRMRGAAERKTPFHFEARPVAKSLVFHLLTPEERKAMADTYDQFSAREIEAILRLMGAVNDNQAVMTRPLAGNIARQEKDESDVRYDARLRDTEMKLRRLGRTSLAHLAFGAGDKMRWCLPAAEGKEDTIEDILKS